MDYQYELDVRGLPCPVPLLRLKKAIGEVKKGEVICMIVDDERCPLDVKAFAYHSRNKLLELQAEGRDLRFYVEKC